MGRSSHETHRSCRRGRHHSGWSRYSTRRPDTRTGAIPDPGTGWTGNPGYPELPGALPVSTPIMLDELGPKFGKLGRAAGNRSAITHFSRVDRAAPASPGSGPILVWDCSFEWSAGQIGQCPRDR
jgi:hypothetical protein